MCGAWCAASLADQITRPCYRWKVIKQTAATIMVSAVLVMWLSTAVYWIVTLVAVAQVYRFLCDLTARSLEGYGTPMHTCIDSRSHSNTSSSTTCNGDYLLPTMDQYDLDLSRPAIQASCASTAALTVNVRVSVKSMNSYGILTDLIG